MADNKNPFLQSPFQNVIDQQAVLPGQQAVQDDAQRFVKIDTGDEDETTPKATSLPVNPNLPAGMRNNNPGNIKYVGQRDAVGPSKNLDQGDPQAVYPSADAGMRAMFRLALKKYDGGRTTANTLIAAKGGWTPGNTQAAANVARTMGLSPDDDLNLNDPAMMARFGRALMLQEHGPASKAYTDDMIAQAASSVASGTPPDIVSTGQPRIMKASFTPGQDGAAPVQQPDMPDTAARFVPMSDDEVKSFSAPDASRFVPLSDPELQQLKINPQPQVDAKAPDFADKASYVGHALKAGVYDAIGAGAKILDAVNPWTLSEQDAAVLYKDDPAKLKQMQDDSTAMILSRFAHAMNSASDQTMQEAPKAAQDYYNSKVYATTDTSKAAYTSPVRVISDVVRNLPTMAAMAVTTYFTRGAAVQAEKTALQEGMTAEAARQAAIRAGVQAAAKVGAVTEGGVGYAQQSEQAYADASKISDAQLAKSPMYQDYLKRGFTPEAARAKVIADTAEMSGQIAGIVDAAVNHYGGQFLGKILTEGGRFIPRVMKGFGNEAATEAVQSGGEQFGQNVAEQKNIDPNKDLGEGVAENVVQGLVVGGVSGGTMAGAGGKGHDGVHAADAPQAAPAVPAAPRAEPTLDLPAAQPTIAAPQATPLAVPVAPAPQAAAAPSAPAGPLTGAVEATAQQHTEQRITVTAPTGEQGQGMLTGFHEDENGEFVAQVQGDDGQVHTLSSADGVSITPESKPDAGPLTAALAPALAEESANPTPPEALQPPRPTKPAEPDYNAMSLDELRARLKYIADQAKSSGGWNTMFMKHRKEVEAAIRVKTEEAKQASKPAEEPLTTGPFDDRSAANKMMLRQAEATGQPHEVVEAGGKFTVQPIQEAANDGSGSRPDAVPQAPRTVDSASPEAQSGAGGDVAGEPAAPANPALTPTAPAVSTEKQLKAFKRIEKGTAFFGTPEKTQAFIDEHGLAATHEVKQTGAKRFEVVAKTDDATAAAPSAEKVPDLAPSQPEETTAVAQPAQPSQLETIRQKHQRQDDAVRQAAENIARRKAEKEAMQAAETAPAEPTVPDLAEQQPAATQAQSAKSKKLTGKSAVAERARRLADYFTPGNVVKGYAGHDRVLSYTPSADGGFSVQVQHVVKQDGQWITAAGDDGRVRTHATMPNERELAAGPVERAQSQEQETPQPAAEAEAPAPTPSQQEPQKPAGDAGAAEPGRPTAQAQADEAAPATAANDAAPTTSANDKNAIFGQNKVFTADAVEKARARLKSKLSQINSGIDPEVMMDGITIAGAYIEAGTRKFADYAKAMVDDLGHAVKPYLLSFYEAARHYPGVENDGMSSPASAQAQHEALMLAHAEVAKTETPATMEKKEGAKRDTATTKEDAGTGAEGQAAGPLRAPEGGRDAGRDAVEGDGGSRAVDRGSEAAVDRSGDEPGQAGLRGRPDAAPADTGEPVQGIGRGGAEPGRRGNREPRSGVANYRIKPGELTREGSWRATAERNVGIVELVKKITDENRQATAEERAELAKFTGWGASEIANGVFPDRFGRYKDATWQKLGERLKSALTDEEYAQARRTTQYAHYTSESVIRSIYAGLDRLGFKGGTLLEPGMGVGHFAGLMPDNVAANSHYTGIEFEPITGAIAKLLYPQSNIIVGDYTRTNLPKDFFDAAIGNPPFSSSKVLNDPEYKSRQPMLHDYFFMKTIDRVKPGGVLVFVTSKGTMDKTSDKSRKYLAERANLLGAIRLPQTAFKDNAGTEVVTDVIFLQKRGAGIPDNGVSWLGTKEVTTPQGPAAINEYFADHPEMVLGTHALSGSMYRANEYTVLPKEGDIEQHFAEAMQNLPENVSRPAQGSLAERALVQDRDFNPKHRKEGGLYLADDGSLMQVESGTGVSVTHRVGSDGKQIALTPKQKQWLKGYVGVRDALKQAQFDQLNDGSWEQSLAALNRAYDGFTAEHGPILYYTTIERTNPETGETTETKRFKNDALLRLDVEGALAYALESIKEDGSIVKGAALNERVLQRQAEPEIKTTQDALFVSLNRHGALNLDDVAMLAGTDKDSVIRDLGTAIYDAPGKGYQLADEYLSGNVVRKLKEAKAAAEVNPKFKRNVDALLAVQPRPLGPTEITVRLGANWVPPSDIASFAQDALGDRMDVSYNPLLGTWSVDQKTRSPSEWSFDKMNAGNVLESVLNARQIKITWRDQEGKTHTDVEATEKANDIASKMRERFRTWIWTDAARADRLTKYYNEHFNNIAPRAFDGSHLTLPGVSARYQLHPHQKRAVWRVIQQGDTYLAHAVGAGKTMEMIASGMEERRLGLVNKPMYVVPNHMLAQFSREFLELYPAANIMVADEQNFHTHNRKRFVAQAALNNPDAIVITHSAFGRVGMSDAYTAKFIQDQIEAWKETLEEADKGDRITVKQIERRIEQLERRLEGAMGKEKKDKVLDFEELGVDKLYVDEFHEFRKLDFPTNQGNVKGIDPNGSQRALDLYMKTQYLRDKKPGRALVAASGTPVTNTMGELFTAQRFFQPEQLKEDGLDTFDAWAAQYGDIVNGFEQNAAGGYEMVGRFAKFQNVPELMRRVRSFMDILTSNNLGALVKRPDVIGGGREVVVTPVPEGYKEYQQSLQQRIQSIRDRKGPPKKGDDIILNVIADGRFSAIDMRFVDPSRPSDPNSKLNLWIDDIIKAYRDTSGYEYADKVTGKPEPQKGASTIGFSDIGLGEASAANRGFDMRAWIEQRMKEAGIPAEHVAFMRDFKQHAKKERLFADMRDGTKRILIGGKEMETGTNVQKRLTHLLHLDAPWFPASVEQREGRIVRQGNQNREVKINAYATKGSYDSTMWGMNARKARFIEQAMNGDDSVRSMDDVSEASAFEMASALASGDERYLKLAGLKTDVERLERLRHAHYDDQNSLRRDKHWAEDAVKRNDLMAKDLRAAIDKRVPIKAGEFAAKIGEKTYDSREEFSQGLFKAFKALGDDNVVDQKTLGTVGGFDINFHGAEMKGSGEYIASLNLDLPGDPDPLLTYPIDPSLAVSGIATRAANQVNGLDRELSTVQNRIDEAKRRITQITGRLGAAFPEEQILMEKVAELNALQEELAKEGEEPSADAAAATVEIDGKPEEGGEPSYSVDDGAALHQLMQDKAGETTIHRDGIGDIEVHYGDQDWGLAHIARRRGQAFMDRLPGLLANGEIYKKANQPDRIFIGDNRDEAVIRLDHGGKPGPWLLTAYEKHPEAPRQSRTEEQAPYQKLSDKELTDALTVGPIGKVIGSLIEHGTIQVHRSVRTLPKEVKVKAGVQAVTMPDGTMHLVAGALQPANARAVLLHEMFHGGVRPMLGNEQWGELIGRIGSLYRQAESSTGKAREFYDRARDRVASAKAKGAVSTRMEVEEFAAYAIEEYEREPSSLPAAIRKWVEDIIGLVKAYIARRYGKQIGALTPAQLSGFAKMAVLDMAAERRGELFGPVGELFSVADQNTEAPETVAPTQQPAAEPPALTPDEQGLLRRMQASVQDNMNRVKQVQDRIMELTGRTTLGKSDYYGAETNRPGRIAARLEDAKDHLTGPLMEGLAKAGKTPEQLSELLHAQHAHERNEAIAKINPDMPDGGSGMTDAEANKIIEKYRGDAKLHELADQARAIARATLDLKLAYGLIKESDHDRLATMYENYVPLKGDGEFGPKIKRAMGHEGRDEHILENIARDYDQAVIVGEKNLARQSLLRMVLQFKDDSLWTARVPPKGRYVAGRVYDVLHGSEKVASFTSQSQVSAFLEAKGPQAAQYTVQDSAGERVAEFTKPLQDNEVMVYIKGDPVRIQIHDETLARQLRPLDQAQMHPILEFMRGTNRFLSKIYTGYNPAFILRNATRDAMTGTINMLGNNGAAIAAKAWARYPQAALALGKWAATKEIPQGKIGSYLTEYRMHGGKVGASYMSDLEGQAQNLQGMFDNARGIAETMKDGGAKRAGKVAWHKSVGRLAHVVEVANQATENALRLGLFIALREEGASAGRAAQAAKQVTVDFDRKGSSTGALGAVYLFFNPAVQGTANAMKTLAKGEHRQQAWAALGAMALLGVYAAASGMSGDKDRWLGEGWDTRTKNLILSFGDHQLRLPMSQEYAPVYALGVAMAEAWHGESKIAAAAHMVSSFIDAYFPLQGAYRSESDNHVADLAQAVTPTVFKPLTNTALNRNAFGSQIVPENEMTKDRPDNLKMYRGTKNSAYDKTAQGIASLGEMMGAGKYENDLSKISPETLKEFWRTYTGGLGQFVTDSLGLAGMAAEPGQIEGGDVPIYKDFVRANDVKPLRSRYFDLAKEAEAAITEFKQAKKVGDGDAIDKIMADPEKARLLALGNMVKKTSKAAAQLGDEKVDVNASTDLTGAEKRAKLKEIEVQEEELYRQALDAFH